MIYIGTREKNTIIRQIRNHFLFLYISYQVWFYPFYHEEV